MYNKLFLIFVFVTVTLTTDVLGQEVSLVQQVLKKHSKTFQREDVRELLPSVLTGLKNSDLEDIPRTISLVITLINAGQAENVKALAQALAGVTLTDDHIMLLEDPAIQALLNDKDVKKLLNDPAAIDELAGLLGVSESESEVTSEQDLPAQEIYDEAINSVVWIQTNQGNGVGSKGSGVLIDKTRRLVVTNAHVVGNAAAIDVFFPWRDQNQDLNKDENFYLQNWEWLENRSYASAARVITQNVRNDVAIIQLDQLSPVAREIEHDFSKNLEDSMRQGDTVHILGNPGNRLWNWTRGIFRTPQQWCLPVPGKGDCLVLEADVHGGNSGGPVLNGQGMLIGILAAGTDETMGMAVPTRNVKALLDTVPVNLVALPPPRTYPKRVFKIRNNTGVPVRYQIRWSNSHDWQPYSLGSGFIRTHRSNGQNVPSSYPRIRFDYIAGDQSVTYRYYTLETVQFRENNDNAPTYRFQYNRSGNRLDLFQDAAGAPALSKAIPKETVLLSNYPNPFNPETWIPYKLSKPAAVTVRIYAADGGLIRKLALGHQPAGVYRSKSRAVYWDGRNAQGEPVASGVYFYTLKAGDFTATRKMLIRK